MREVATGRVLAVLSSWSTPLSEIAATREFEALRETPLPTRFRFGDGDDSERFERLL